MLSTVDADLAAVVAEELHRHDVRVVTGTAITSITRDGDRLTVTGHAAGDPADPFSATVNLVLVVVGVRPDTALAQTAGVALGVKGRVAGENAVGGERMFAGSVGTQVVKVFDLVATRTGLPHRRLRHRPERPRPVLHPAPGKPVRRRSDRGPRVDLGPSRLVSFVLLTFTPPLADRMEAAQP
jgi:NADPH-dependent 2,4-dienoyl-CoA reductase/sulfur reductase-like enzyme